MSGKKDYLSPADLRQWEKAGACHGGVDCFNSLKPWSSFSPTVNMLSCCILINFLSTVMAAAFPPGTKAGIAAAKKGAIPPRCLPTPSLRFFANPLLVGLNDSIRENDRRRLDVNPT